MFRGIFFLIFLILSPFIIGLFVLGAFNRDKVFGKAILGLYLSGGLFLSYLIFISWWRSPKELRQSDIYGEYIIDREIYPGHQADWQYDHFRFEILPNDSIHFYETDGERIIKSHNGMVSFLPNYIRPRLGIEIDTPRHHIIEDRPTLYRKPHSFYYVFHSPKFGNVFFRKGKWESTKTYSINNHLQDITK